MENQSTDWLAHSILIIHCIISVYNKTRASPKKVIQGLWKNTYLLDRIIIYFRYPVRLMMIIVLVPFKVLHGDEGGTVVVVASINKVDTQKYTAGNHISKSSQSRFYFPFSILLRFSNSQITWMKEWERNRSNVTSQIGGDAAIEKSIILSLCKKEKCYLKFSCIAAQLAFFSTLQTHTHIQI